MSQRSTVCPWGSSAALLPRAGGAPDSWAALAPSPARQSCQRHGSSYFVLFWKLTLPREACFCLVSRQKLTLRGAQGDIRTKSTDRSTDTCTGRGHSADRGHRGARGRRSPSRVNCRGFSQGTHLPEGCEMSPLGYVTAAAAPAERAGPSGLCLAGFTSGLGHRNAPVSH